MVHHVDVVTSVRELLLDVVPVSAKDMMDVMDLLANVKKANVFATHLAAQSHRETGTPLQHSINNIRMSTFLYLNFT